MSRKVILPHCIQVLTHFLFLALLSPGGYRDDITEATLLKMYWCYVLATVQSLLPLEQ